MLDSCRSLQAEGFDITYLPVQKNGLVDLEEFKAAIRPDTILVSVMFVNNEIGVVQPIEEIGEICKQHKIFFHTDAAQGSRPFLCSFAQHTASRRKKKDVYPFTAVGKIPIDVNEMKIDLMSISGHKVPSSTISSVCCAFRSIDGLCSHLPLSSTTGVWSQRNWGSLRPPTTTSPASACVLWRRTGEVRFDGCFVVGKCACRVSHVPSWFDNVCSRGLARRTNSVLRFDPL